MPTLRTWPERVFWLIALVLFVRAMLGCQPVNASDMAQELEQDVSGAYCGWVPAEPEPAFTFPPGPECWTLTAPQRTTAPPSSGPCDVTSETRVWPGGATVSVWVEYGAAYADLVLTAVECDQ